MVEHNVVQSSNKALVSKQSITAVFVGGTSGIGENAVRALASTHGASGRGLRAYIVGRNEKAANLIIADCKKNCPSGEFKFVCANDLSSLKDVDRVCEEITRAEEGLAAAKVPCIDLLVLTQAYFAFGGELEHKVTNEGLERSLCLLYYSRMRFVYQLLPLLSASPISGRVVSVFGPGRDTKLILDDLSLQKPKNFTFTTLGSHAAYMTTFFFEKIAANNERKVSLSHYFPKLVITPAFKGSGIPTWFKVIFGIASPLFRLMSLSTEENGDRVLFHTSPRFPARSAVTDSIEIALSSDGIVGGGAYRTNWDGEVVPLTKEYKQINKGKVRETVWEHTMKAFQSISAGGRFSV